MVAPAASVDYRLAGAEYRPGDARRSRTLGQRGRQVGGKCRLFEKLCRAQTGHSAPANAGLFPARGPDRIEPGAKKRQGENKNQQRNHRAIPLGRHLLRGGPGHRDGPARARILFCRLGGSLAAGGCNHHPEPGRGSGTGRRIRKTWQSQRRTRGAAAHQAGTAPALRGAAAGCAGGHRSPGADAAAGGF